MARMEPNESKDMNRDPITGAPGSHPVGTGIGAAGGGAAGTAIGSAAGPVGTVAGAVIGDVAGGLAGKGVAEQIDPTAEEEYWRVNYKTRSYVPSGATYDQFAPAYRYGWESRRATRARASTRSSRTSTRVGDPPRQVAAVLAERPHGDARRVGAARRRGYANARTA